MSTQNTIEKEQPCPFCRHTRPVIKSGLNATGSQRYKCRACNRYFTPQPKPMGYDFALKEKALLLYLEGASLRAIGRICNVHHHSVANWIAVSAQQQPQQVHDTTPTEAVEIDELFTYIGKKQTFLRSDGGGKGERVDVGQAVLKERSWEAMQQLVDELPAAQNYCTDQFSVYADLDWPEESSHIISKGKRDTHTIESVNANLHTYLGRLKRKSRCFSRRLNALQQAVRLFVWHYNRRQRVVNVHTKYRGQLALIF